MIGDMSVNGGGAEISTDFEAELRMSGATSSLDVDSKLGSHLLLQHGGADTYAVKNVGGKLSFVEKSEATAMLDINTRGDLSVHRKVLVEPFRVDGKESATVNVQSVGNASVNVSSSHGGAAGSVPVWAGAVDRSGRRELG